MEVKKDVQRFISANYYFDISLEEPQHFILALSSTACPLTPVYVYVCASLCESKKKTLTRNLFASWWVLLDPRCLSCCQAQSVQTMVRVTYILKLTEYTNRVC